MRKAALKNSRPLFTETFVQRKVLKLSSSEEHLSPQEFLNVPILQDPTILLTFGEIKIPLGYVWFRQMGKYIKWNSVDVEIYVDLSASTCQDKAVKYVSGELNKVTR